MERNYWDLCFVGIVEFIVNYIWICWPYKIFFCGAIFSAYSISSFLNNKMMILPFSSFPNFQLVKENVVSFFSRA